MKNLVMMVSVVVLFSAGSVFGLGTYDNNGTADGSEGNPYEIANAAQLIELSNHTEDYGLSFILTANIDMTGQSITPIGLGANLFTGHFDGGGFVVSNLTINTPGSDHVGLFGATNSSAVVDNLALTKVNISGRNYSGGLMGTNYGVVSNCYSSGSVSGTHAVGGIVGYNYGTVMYCHSNCAVTGTGNYTGGLVGITVDTVSYCYSTGNVIGDDAVGGLLGGNGNPGTTTNCYSTGTVQGNSSVGGLCGANYQSIVDCFWDMDTSGMATSAGGTGVTGLSTAEMQRASAFINDNWDFVGTWDIGENQTYPFLANKPIGDMNHDGRTDMVDFAILSDHWLEGVSQ